MTYKMYIMTPSDQISQDLSYRSGPRTSGAAKKGRESGISIEHSLLHTNNKFQFIYTLDWQSKNLPT